MNKLKVSETQIQPGNWLEENKKALRMCRYVNTKPGGETAADAEELRRCEIFSPMESPEDREWVAKLVEQVEYDLDHRF